MIADHESRARITLSLIDYGRSRGARRRRRMQVFRIAALILALGAIVISLIVKSA